MTNNREHKYDCKYKYIGLTYVCIFAAVLLSFIIPESAAHASLFSTSQSVTATSSCTSGLSCGLVGYWTFDGKDTVWTSAAAATTLDKSGNGNTGTLNNYLQSTAVVQGKAGQALNFNGSTNHLTAPSTKFLALPTTAYTIGLWIWDDTPYASLSTFHRIISWSAGSTATNLQFGLGTGNASPNRMFYLTYGSANALAMTSGNISNGWNHAVVTFDGSVYKMYVNGVLRSQDSYTRNDIALYAAASLYIGQRGNGAYVSGEVDDVRIYNRALSAAEIQQLYNMSASVNARSSNVTPTSSCTSGLSCGLVGYWTFDGKDTNWATGKTLDKSGSGNTGSLINMSTTTSPVVGKVGQGLKFNGSTSYVSASSTSLNIVGNLTVTAWVKPVSGITTVPGIVCDSVNYRNSYCLFTNNSSKQISFSVNPNGTSCYVIAGGSFTSDKWNHVVGMWDGTNMSVYVNGIRKYLGTGLTCGSITRVFSGITTGRSAGNSTNDKVYYNGTIDDVRIYNRALSASEVGQIYSMGSTTFARSPTVTATTSCTSGLSCGLVGYWTFDGKDTNWATGKTLDKSGSGNTGSLIGMSTTSSPVTGKVGQGLGFNGSSSYVNLSTISSVTKFGSFSVSLWFKANSQDCTNDPTLLQHTLTATNMFVIQRPTCSILSAGVYDGGGAGYISKSASFSDTTKWHNIIVTYSASTTIAYLDNIVMTGTTNPGTGVSVNFHIGEADSGRYFNGSIDDVRIYNRALSASEVSQLYNAGR